MKKIFGCVILYYPQEDIYDNIASYSSFLDRLVIIDNSEIPFPIDSKRFNDNTIILQDKSNKGIAERLNQAAKIAIDSQAKWLLTMDQDSHFGEGAIEQYLRCINTYEEKEKVAMFGVNEKISLTTNADCSPSKTEHLITSGSIINLNLYAQTGGFDEKLFIDEVDHEYCYRCILAEYEILRFDNIALQHSLGTKANFISLKNFRQSTRTLHSPLRIYYMVRNYLYVRNLYGNKIHQLKKKRDKDLFITLKNNLLYNKQCFRVLANIFKGWADYKNNRMGKRE